MVQRGSRHECRRHVATCPEEKVQGYMGIECQSCGLVSFASVGARCSCRLVIQAGVGSVNILPERPSPPDVRSAAIILRTAKGLLWCGYLGIEYGAVSPVRTALGGVSKAPWCLYLNRDPSGSSTSADNEEAAGVGGCMLSLIHI